jgi:hypothetical protein
MGLILYVRNVRRAGDDDMLREKLRRHANHEITTPDEPTTESKLKERK